MSESDLEVLRARMEEVSQELVRVLNRRFELTRAVGRLKRGSNQAFRDPAREAELIARLEANSDGPLPAETLRAVMRVVLDASVQLMEEGAEDD